MKRPDIEAIKKRCEKATPGPWKTDKFGCYIWGPQQEMVADTVSEENSIFRMRGVGGKLPIQDNLNFIVNARTDIPVLIAYIEELEKELGDDEPDEETRYYQDLLGY